MWAEHIIYKQDNMCKLLHNLAKIHRKVMLDILLHFMYLINDNCIHMHIHMNSYLYSYSILTKFFAERLQKFTIHTNFN